MTTKTIDIAAAQADLLQVIEEVRAGTEVVLANEDGPLVRLVPVAQPVTQPKRIAGLNRGAMTVHDDFDDPLPDSFWLGEE